LDNLDLKYLDLSEKNSSTDDFPDFAKKVVDSMKKTKQSLGILACGTGIGMSIAANRNKNIRAALCDNPKDAELARKHNDANILVLKGWYKYKDSDLKKIIKNFFGTKFERGRHLRRIKKLDRLS